MKCYTYPYYYLSKNFTMLTFCEITNCHPHSAVSVSSYLVNNIVIFIHFITVAAPTPLECTTSRQSQPT